MSGPRDVRSDWTDEQCLQFAAVAFRHAPKNLPDGVTLEDIRIAAKVVLGNTSAAGVLEWVRNKRTLLSARMSAGGFHAQEALDMTMLSRLEHFLIQQPAAPVGVEDWRRLGGAQRFLDWNRKQAEPPVRIGWEHQVFEAALDQQPAAVDEEWQVQLADALECFWNAALGGVREYDDSTASAVMSGMVQGVAAVADRLRERAGQQQGGES